MLGLDPAQGCLGSVILTLLFFFALIPTLLVSSLLGSRQGDQNGHVPGLGIYFSALLFGGRMCLILLNYGTFVVFLLCGRHVSMLGAGGTMTLDPDLPRECSGFVAWCSELRAQRREQLFCLGSARW